MYKDFKIFATNIIFPSFNAYDSKSFRGETNHADPDGG